MAVGWVKLFYPSVQHVLQACLWDLHVPRRR